MARRDGQKKDNHGFTFYIVVWKCFLCYEDCIPFHSILKKIGVGIGIEIGIGTDITISITTTTTITITITAP